MKIVNHKNDVLQNKRIIIIKYKTVYKTVKYLFTLITLHIFIIHIFIITYALEREIEINSAGHAL